MPRPFRRRLAVSALLALGSLGLLLSLLHASPGPTASLGGEERYLTHVSTDKPLYRPGETVFVRGVMLHAHTSAPIEGTATAHVEVKGPKGDTVAQGMSQAQDGVLGFQWSVPEGQAGGEYTIKVTFPWDGHTPAERKFDVRAYRAPRLKSQIVFVRDGYGPGDTVQASLHTERAEGGAPAGAAVTVIARLDGTEAYRGTTTVDPAGNCRAEFALPELITRGEGSLAFVVEDGGVVETASKTIPILLQTVDLQLFPESGELVAGIQTRVYLEARTPAKKPADIAGVVEDMAGNVVARFRTRHEGRGRFLLDPRKDRRYVLRITEPTGIDQTWELPPVRETGALVRSMDDRAAAGAPVRLIVGATEKGRYTVTLRKREREVARREIWLKAGETEGLRLRPEGEAAEGVLVATLWNPDGRPVAERLVYREPSRALRIKIDASKERFVPGEAAELTVTTTDADGKPVSAVVGLTVTDDSVLEMIEKREQAPRLPVMVLLEDDVRELADAHVYLDPADEKAPLAVDLLLGTQGWRRFAFADPAALIREHGDQVDHLRRIRE